MTRRVALLLAVCTLAAAAAVEAQTAPRRRALLIGINDYTASRLRAAPRQAPPPARDWPNLTGAANDVAILREMLVLLYGFDERDIVSITDQEATRAAIVQSLETLARAASKGDVVFFYYAGHGSQVRNSLSEEPDKLDETIVPADSRLGVPDIRDKELRVFFNRILDRGARLSIFLDKCHGASGARGLATGARPRGIRRDPRDVADGSHPGPRPEDRGALVLAASQDFDAAWETRDDDGNFHGAFSWAWIRALRDASSGEPAADTFLRAQARLRAETPFQDPVMAGSDEARLTPFLGTRVDRQGERAVVAVESVRDDGTVVLQGGWANGLALGSELRVVSDREISVRFTVSAMRGLGRSEARIASGREMPQAVRSGALMEVVGWAAPAGRPLRVWTPRVSGSVRNVASLARRLNAEASKRGVRWISDPTDVTPAYLLRRAPRGWELLAASGEVEMLGGDAAAIAAVARMRAGSSLFVQFPATAAMLDGIAVGPGTDREGIEPVARAEEADYLLVGRYASARKMEYAWIRPLVGNGDRRKTGLPLRSAWVAEDERDQTLRDSVAALRDAVMRLRRIHAWHLLESPPDTRAPYRLAFRRGRDLVRDTVLIGEDVYSIVLRAASTPLPRVAPRYYYAFTIDSHGRSFLAFPQNGGSVENRFPLAPPAPATIELGEASRFQVQPPYGVDTWFLLSTDQPLANPWVLEWNGVRAPATGELSPLEQLLALVGSPTRAGRLVTPTTWSLEKMAYEAVPPRRRR